jgi:hypothetical protein
MISRTATLIPASPDCSPYPPLSASQPDGRRRVTDVNSQVDMGRVSQTMCLDTFQPKLQTRITQFYKVVHALFSNHIYSCDGYILPYGTHIGSIKPTLATARF